VCRGRVDIRSGLRGVPVSEKRCWGKGGKKQQSGQNRGRHGELVKRGEKGVLKIKESFKEEPPKKGQKKILGVVAKKKKGVKRKT